MLINNDNSNAQQHPKNVLIFGFFNISFGLSYNLRFKITDDILVWTILLMKISGENLLAGLTELKVPTLAFHNFLKQKHSHLLTEKDVFLNSILNISPLMDFFPSRINSFLDLSYIFILFFVIVLMTLDSKKAVAEQG